MTSTYTPPGLTVEQLRARAELYLIEHLSLPPGLLPSALGGPAQHVALELRSLAQRRLRLADRLNTAAVNVASGAVALAHNSNDGQPLPAGVPSSLDPAELASAGELYRVVLELDHQLRQWAGVLVRLADEAAPALSSARK